MTILEVKNVSKNFSGVAALVNVSLSVSRSRVMGLIGPNGSGKTTLLNVISGVLRPDGGDIFLDGQNVTGMPAHKIARLGITRTFQNVRLFRQLTARENVQTTVSIHDGKAVDATVESLLIRLGLTEWADRDSGTLPYGIQRRLEIARALGARPQFLLLDEPAAGLNEQESEELLDVIRGISTDANYGCGILVIDHDLRLIMRLCDEIHVLNEGHTIGTGSPQEILDNPMVIEAYLGKSQEVSV